MPPNERLTVSQDPCPCHFGRTAALTGLERITDCIAGALPCKDPLGMVRAYRPWEPEGPEDSQDSYDLLDSFDS
eukprot:7089105-Alexandrium_andersonii.AAC.1